jgi:hypothetical protein
VREWIDRLGLQIKDAAQHVGMETDQLERVLNFPDGATPTRVLLQVLEGLGLGIVGVESLTPAMLLRHFDQVRETKGMSKTWAGISADGPPRASCGSPCLRARCHHRRPGGSGQAAPGPAGGAPSVRLTSWPLWRP